MIPIVPSTEDESSRIRTSTLFEMSPEGVVSSSGGGREASILPKASERYCFSSISHSRNQESFVFTDARKPEMLVKIK